MRQAKQRYYIMMRPALFFSTHVIMPHPPINGDNSDTKQGGVDSGQVRDIICVLALGVVLEQVIGSGDHFLQAAWSEATRKLCPQLPLGVKDFH